MAATEVYHGSHVAWQEQYILFRMGKMFFLMQNIFIVPAVQYGCRAKTPLYVRRSKLVIRPKPATEEQVSSWKIIVRSYAFSTKWGITDTQNMLQSVSTPWLLFTMLPWVASSKLPYASVSKRALLAKPSVHMKNEFHLHEKHICIWKVSYENSFWNRGTRQLGNDLLKRVLSSVTATKIGNKAGNNDYKDGFECSIYLLQWPLSYDLKTTNTANI